MSLFQQTSTGDLALVNGQLVLVTDPVIEAAHKIRSQLLFFAGEWFLDTLLGVPYFSVVLVKNPDLDVIRRLLSQTITNASPLVTDVPVLEMTLGSDRVLHVYFEARVGDSVVSGSLGGDIFVNGVSVTPAVPVFLSASAIGAGGGTVTITGQNFTPNAVVKTDGVARTTTYVSPFSLTAVVPAHAAGSVSVEVVQTSGTTGVQANALTYIALPTVVSASSVTDVGGVTTITGTGFTPDAVVNTDGVNRATTYVNATTLTAVVPAHVAGVVLYFVSQFSGSSGTGTLTYTASAVDPVTLTPSGYWEQRNDANDYSLASGIWAKRSATGSNWVQGVQPSLPAVGSLVDGKAPWYPHADNTHGLDNAGSWATYGSTTQLAGSILLYVPSGLGAYGAYANAAPSIFGDVINQQYWTLGAGTSGGLTYVGISLFDGAIKDARVQVTPDTWLQFNFRANAGVLAVSVNVAPSTGTALNPFTNNAFSLTSHSTAVPCPGVMVLSKFLKLAMADADFTTIRTWWRSVQYPSLAGVLPA